MTNRRLQPLFVLLMTVSVALVACAESASETTQVAEEPNATSEPTETSEAAESTQTSEQTEPVKTVVEVVPSGEEALAAAAGEPHVLWFWGAH